MSITENDQYAKNIQSFGKKTKAILFLIILLTFGISIMGGTFDIVESGQVKIAVEPDGSIKGPIEPGWHVFWCNPFSAKYSFTTQAQAVKYTNMHADTLDGHVNIDITVSYVLPKENVTNMFKTYGPNYQTYIDAVITSAFRDAFSSNTMRAVALENRSLIQGYAEVQIEKELHEYYIDLLALKVQNILLPTAFSEAQIQTQIAYEELRAANISRQISLLEANTAAEVALIEAMSQANITIMKANTTTEALEIVVQQLNVTGNLTESHVLTYLYLQQLEVLAQYGNVLIITDGSVPFVVDLPDNSTGG